MILIAGTVVSHDYDFGCDFRCHHYHYYYQYCYHYSYYCKCECYSYSCYDYTPATHVLNIIMNYTLDGGIAIALAAAATTPTPATTSTIHDNATTANVAVADAPTRTAQS